MHQIGAFHVKKNHPVKGVVKEEVRPDSEKGRTFVTLDCNQNW